MTENVNLRINENNRLEKLEFNHPCFNPDHLVNKNGFELISILDGFLVYFSVDGATHALVVNAKDSHGGGMLSLQSAGIFFARSGDDIEVIDFNKIQHRFSFLLETLGTQIEQGQEENIFVHVLKNVKHSTYNAQENVLFMIHDDMTLDLYKEGEVKTSDELESGNMIPKGSEIAFMNAHGRRAVVFFEKEARFYDFPDSRTVLLSVIPGAWADPEKECIFVENVYITKGGSEDQFKLLDYTQNKHELQEFKLTCWEGAKRKRDPCMRELIPFFTLSNRKAVTQEKKGEASMFKWEGLEDDHVLLFFSENSQAVSLKNCKSAILTETHFACLLLNKDAYSFFMLDFERPESPSYVMTPGVKMVQTGTGTSFAIQGKYSSVTFIDQHIEVKAIEYIGRVIDIDATRALIIQDSTARLEFFESGETIVYPEPLKEDERVKLIPGSRDYWASLTRIGHDTYTLVVRKGADEKKTYKRIKYSHGLTLNSILPTEKIGVYRPIVDMLSSLISKDRLESSTISDLGLSR